MKPRGSTASRRIMRPVVVLSIVGLSLAFGLFAFAAPKPKAPSAVPAPVFTQTPPDPSPVADASFTWSHQDVTASFECSKENGPWYGCTSPHSYTVGITTNSQHQFAVRAVDPTGKTSSPAAYRWKVEKIDFTINGTLGLLYPGTWRAIDVIITNPNSYAVELTSLTVGVASSPPGCPASENIEIQQSSLSTSQTFTVSRNSTAALHVDLRPLIRLKNLHESQDACKNGTFDLTYRGTGTK